MFNLSGVPLFGDNVPNLPQRSSISPVDLQFERADVSGNFPRKRGHTPEHKRDTSYPGSLQENVYRDVGFPIHALRIDEGQCVESMCSRHFDGRLGKTVTRYHGTLICANISNDACEFSDLFDVNWILVILAVDHRKNLIVCDLRLDTDV